MVGIERVWLDANGEPLLNLYRWTQTQFFGPTNEQLPDIQPVGQVEDVGSTGLRIYTGPDLLRAGQYSLTLATHGRTHADNFEVQRQIVAAATQTRAIQRGSAVLPIARFSSIKRSFQGAAQFGGDVEVVFEAASPYWLTERRRESVPVGIAHPVHVGGQARAPLTISITAGAAPLTNPEIVTDAGLTRWLGTVPAGQTLVIRHEPGRWAVTLDGQPAHLALTGPQPYLNPGSRSLTITAPGATAEAVWQEGEL